MVDLKSVIESNYGIGVSRTEKIKNAYKITTDEGVKCFKSSKYDQSQFEFIVSAIFHLIENQYEGILNLYSTVDKKSYLNLNGSFGFLCDWIDSREADFNNPVELRLCIDSLSKLHLASRGFKPIIIPGVRNLYGKWIKRFKKRSDELLYFKAIIKEKEHLSEFDKLYLKYFDYHYKQGLRAIKNLEDSNYLRVIHDHKKMAGFCHHDTANHNFLITSELRMYMIDFDYCIFDSHLHDLGSIIIRNLKYGNWNMDALEYILDIYSKNIPISSDELRIIVCFMEFPQDFWQVGLQYYVENQAWDEEFFIRKLGRVITDAKERWEFLMDLEGRV